MQTKEEFYDYIDSFNKKPGTYTSEELFEIGVEHKKLPQNQKSWSDLAEYVGYPGDPENLRAFIKRMQAKEGSLPLKEKVEDVVNNSEYEEVYKERVKNREVLNAYKANLKREAKIDNFNDELIKAVKNLKPIKFENVKVRKGGVEAILLLSDLHIGVDCNNFYNTYNAEVAAKRLAKLASDTIRYCEVHKVSILNVCNLGDMISGYIHTNARLEQQMNVVDQITTAAELISTLLAELIKTGCKIIYRSCTDNHSRAMANKEDNLEVENFNRLIDYIVQTRLSNSNIKFVNDNLDPSIGSFSLMNGKRVIFSHGHLDNINKCVDAYCGATKEFIDYVLLSHFHCAKEKSYNGSRLIINGSVVGTEQYALSRRLFSPAEQKLLIFDEDNLLDYTINLQ